MASPIRYVKAHPLASVVAFASGMVFGPWLVGVVGRTTGVGLNLPTVGNGS